MPIPIAKLFQYQNDADIHRMPMPKDISDMSKGWQRIPVALKDIPELDYPLPETTEFKEDMSTLKKRFFNPVNTQDFLNLSNAKPFELIKRFCKEYALDVDLKDLDDLNDHFSRLILTLKFKYNRPRPKKFMNDHHDSFPYDRILSNETPSYPSGHSAHAYFNCCIVADMYPEHAVKLFNLADMVGQSRIDLGKHYPSDVSFGRYIGELVGNAYLNQTRGSKGTIVKEHKHMSREELRIARGRIRQASDYHNQKILGTSYVDELCEFLIQSNAIERYKVSIDDAYQASKNFLRGLPVSYCSDSEYVKSHLAGIEVASLAGKIDSPNKIIAIHKAIGNNVLERGEAGVLRPFDHYARGSGYKFSQPGDILSDLNLWCQKNNDNFFERHVEYECIHPFSDGNGRSGRIILAADLNFDLAALNDMIGKDYIPSLIEYQNKYIR